MNKVKTTASKLALWLIPYTFAAATLVGCTTATPKVTTQEQPVVTPVFQTNVVQQVNPTNGVTTTVTNVVTIEHTNFVPVLVTNTVYSVDTNKINQIVTGAQTVGTIASAYSPPAGMAISTAAGIAGTLLFAISTGIAAYKNQQKKSILQAVITGIEGASPQGNDTAPTTVAAVKQSVQTEAVNSGVQTALHEIVRQTT